MGRGKLERCGRGGCRQRAEWEVRDKEDVRIMHVCSQHLRDTIQSYDGGAVVEELEEVLKREDLKTYKVLVTESVCHSAVVEVKAISEEQAKNLAELKYTNDEVSLTPDLEAGETTFTIIA